MTLKTDIEDIELWMATFSNKAGVIPAVKRLVALAKRYEAAPTGFIEVVGIGVPMRIWPETGRRYDPALHDKLVRLVIDTGTAAKSKDSTLVVLQKAEKAMKQGKRGES